MDVRCEKCQTEYELDEAKLKPGGVTVKCTTCGHMFRVRRRGQTEQGAGSEVSQVGPAPTSHRPGPSLSPEELDLAGDGGERTWLVQLDDGEIRTCRELATLQRWIVGGMVSRTCTISRTGKKWKRLGEIPELASYFQIADEARSSRQKVPTAGGEDEARSLDSFAPRPPDPASATSTRPMGSARAPSEVTPTGRRMSGAPRPPTGEHEVVPPELMHGSPPPAAPSPALRAAVASIDPRAQTEAALPSPIGNGRMAGVVWPGTPVAGQPAPAPYGAAPSAPSGPYGVAPAPYGAAPSAPSGGYGQPAPYGAAPSAPSGGYGQPAPYGAAPSPPSGPYGVAPASHGPSGPYGAVPASSSGGWAVQPVPSSPPMGPSGPAYGLARGLPGSEAAFVAGGGARLPDAAPAYGDDFGDRSGADSDYELPRSRAALWVALASLIVLGGGAAAIAYMMRSGGESPATAQTPETPAPTTPAPTATPIPAPTPTPAATPTPPTEPSPAAAAVLTEVDAALAADRASAIEDLLARLGSAGDAASVLVARARLENALAQQQIDRAALAATPAEGKKLIVAAKETAGQARALLDRALPLAPKDGAALLALADARRLAGESALEVERGLKEAQRAGGDAREASRILALLRVRDGRGRDARRELDKLATDAGNDARIPLRLALLDLAEGKTAEAKTRLDQVSAIAADHAVAALAAKRVADAPIAVEPSDPMPPEEPAPPAPSGGAGGGGPAGSYESALARAEQLAEKGRCGEAVRYYREAIDDRPAGVEALTGLGYCHLDARDYASAFAKFRAALGVSPRYQEAMWGIAEMYERQGAKDKAVEKYREFLAEHPNSSKAETARRQIERLSGGVTPPADPPRQGETAPAGEAPPSTTPVEPAATE